MKRIRILPFLLLAAFSGLVQAQDTDSTKNLFTRFHSFNTIQVLNGSSETSLAVNSVNGFRFEKLFFGVGTGFDYYYHRSIPLFLEARLSVLKNKNTLQVFADAGLNFAFGGQGNKGQTKTGRYTPGAMYGAGIDYVVSVKSNAFVIGAAFCNKEVIQMVDNNIWNPVLNRVENIPIKEKYSLNRIALRIGWMF
jgi:hypothetical protein